MPSTSDISFLFAAYVADACRWARLIRPALTDSVNDVAQYWRDVAIANAIGWASR